MSKLPVPSVSMPYESRILQSSIKGQVLLAFLRPSGGLILCNPNDVMLKRGCIGVIIPIQPLKDFRVLSDETRRVYALS